MVTYKEARENRRNIVISLLTKEWNSTRAIHIKGKQKGYFVNRITYEKGLDDLYKSKLINKMKTNFTVNWRLK